MKTLKVYQEQYAALQRDIVRLFDDAAQVLHDARIDGHKIFDVMDPPKASPDAPSFDL